MIEAASSIMAQIWLSGSQIALKKRMQYLKEEVRDEVEYFDEDKYLKKIPISLQYLKKMLWNEVIFLPVGNHFFKSYVHCDCGQVCTKYPK